MVQTVLTSGEAQRDVVALLKANQALGSDLSEAVREGSEKLWASAARIVPAGTHCDEDVSYGPHGRHRLDVYYQRGGRQSLPVVVFVHGGGFTGGDKRRPDSFLYQNIGNWAVGQGMVGVNITYRLAPAAQWPAVVEDISAALTWVVENIADYGGDPESIVLIGHSAGAAHVADYVARCHTRPARHVFAKGAVLISGVYDILSAADRESVQAYYGVDPAEHRERSSVPGVAAGNTPLLVAVAEHEPASFHQQGLQLANAVLEQRGAMPLFTVAEGHNHFSETHHWGSEDTRLSGAVAAFILKVTGRQYAV